MLCNPSFRAVSGPHSENELTLRNHPEWAGFEYVFLIIMTETNHKRSPHNDHEVTATDSNINSFGKALCTQQYHFVISVSAFWRRITGKSKDRAGFHEVVPPSNTKSYKNCLSFASFVPRLCCYCLENNFLTRSEVTLAMMLGLISNICTSFVQIWRMACQMTLLYLLLTGELYFLSNSIRKKWMWLARLAVLCCADLYLCSCSFFT